MSRWNEPEVYRIRQLKWSSPKLAAHLFEQLWLSAEQEIEQLQKVLDKMFATDPEKTSNWQYSREECANLARQAVEESRGNSL